MTTNTYKCPKCNGSGYLSCYAGIAGGVCFSCAGSGVKVGTPPVPGAWWRASAVAKDSGNREAPFCVKARSASEALRKARKTFANGSAFIPESAAVEFDRP